MLHFFLKVAFISHRKEAAVKMKAYDVDKKTVCVRHVLVMVTS